MKNARRVPVAAVVLLLGSLRGGKASADLALPGARVHDLVALIAPHDVDKTTGNPFLGSAIIVGYDAHYLYLVTARHVVVDPNATQDKLPPAVEVLLFQTRLSKQAATVALPKASAVRDPGKRLGSDGPVGLQIARDPAIDAYIDRLPWSALGDPTPFATSPDGRSTIRVHAVGNRAEKVDELPNEELYAAKDGDLMDCHGEYGADYQGNSGGALFDASYHLVGMLIREPDPGSFTAVDIRVVLAIAQEKMAVRLEDPKPYLQVDGNVAATLTVDSGDASNAIRPMSPYPFVGRHAVRLTSPSYRDWSGKLELGPWEVARAEYRLGAIPCATWPWRVLLCAGTGAFLAGGVGVGIEALSAAHDFDSNPSSADLSKLRLLNGATDVLFGFFITGAATIALDFILNTPHLEIERVSASAGIEGQDGNGTR